MKIALGVSGGIAAYKAAEIVRLLQDRGIKVQVVMTRAAQEFIRPLTFASLTGEKVITDLFSSDSGKANLESAIEHIAVAQSIDAFAVVPATADVLAKFAHGLADDFLSTLFLATTAPTVLAPAMNVNMWDNPATQANLETLRKRGIKIVEPDSGFLACGMVGPGRLAANEKIVDAILEALSGPRDLAGEKIVISAGPTREKIDPVRYISNRSSGKMGYALAEAAARRGAEVILVSGPTNLNAPTGVQIVRVESADEMLAAITEHAASATALIKAAAVSDYRPKEQLSSKMKRHDAFALEMVPTVDIVAGLKNRPEHQIVVGFAAETENVLENARKKLIAKSLDIIVANDVSQPGIGFDSDSNAVTILTRDGVVEVPLMSKREVADRILNVVRDLRLSKANQTKVNA